MPAARRHQTAEQLLNRHVRLVAIAGLVAGCGGQQQAPRPRPTPGSALVVVGDSLAAGRFADTQAGAFPQRLATRTHARLELVGIPGATTAQLAAQPLPSDGKTIVVETGTNDFVHQTPRERFKADYRTLLDNVRQASPGAKLVCLTTWMPDDVATQIRGKIPPSFYDATIRHACRTTVDLKPLTNDRGPAGRQTFLGPGDDFHPNDAGHAAIARAVAAKLG